MHTLAIPLYASGASAVILFIQFLAQVPASDSVQESRKDVTKYGGTTILIHNILRLLACLALVALSVASVVIVEVQTDVKLQLSICGFYVSVDLSHLHLSDAGTRYMHRFLQPQPLVSPPEQALLRRCI